MKPTSAAEDFSGVATSSDWWENTQ